MGIFTVACGRSGDRSINECLETLSKEESLTLDTETTGLDPHKDQIVSLQIGTQSHQWFIDVRNIDIKLFKDLLESHLCILHNAKFDYKMLLHAGIMLDKIYDTMLAECVIYCGYEDMDYSLAALYTKYLNITLDKSQRLTFRSEETFTDAQITYGCRDIEYLHVIKSLQEQSIRKFGLEYCVNLENKAVKAFADMEYNGLFLCKDSWSKVTKLYKEESKKIQQRLDNIVSTDPKLKSLKPPGIQTNLFGLSEREVKVNYGSPAQVKNICHLLGFLVDNTNETEISKYARAENGEVIWAKHPFMGELLLYREVSKIISTYGDKFLTNIHPVTGRIHTDFWQVKDTGRVSSSNPNLQNLPNKNIFRNCFLAREGFTWVIIDFSGQELRLMADASKEDGFIDVLNRGEDLHCYAGSMMFKRPITKNDKELRNKAKTINFGKPYGMGPDKLANSLGITKSEAEDLFKQYAEAFPKLNKWLDTQSKEAIRRGYSQTFTPCGRIRWYPLINRAKELRKAPSSKETWKEILTIEGNVQRQGANSPIQGTGADITKEALVGVRELVLKYNKLYGEVAYLLCTVHDAIDVEVRDDLAEQFSKEMETIMIDCGNKYVSSVKMEVDTTLTKQWAK